MVTKNGNGDFKEVNTDENEGWEEVSAESQLLFDTIGDEWIGRFMGMDQIGAKGMWQAHFDGIGENAGESYFTNVGHDLRVKLEKVPAKYIVKMRYESDLPTGQAKPMKVFRVWSKA